MDNFAGRFLSNTTLELLKIAFFMAGSIPRGKKLLRPKSHKPMRCPLGSPVSETDRYSPIINSHYHELIYDTKAEGLEKINEKLDELQTKINIGSSKLEQNKKNFTNQSIMYYITIVLFIIFVSSLALVRNNKQYLRLLSIPIAVLSIVYITILYTVNKIKIVEAFSTTPNSPTIIENNNVKVLDAFNKYLLHTLYISLLLKSYKHYNVTNDSINKEFNYYNKQEIKQKHINSKIVDSNAVYYLDNKIYEYRSYMLHIITVIITSSILLSSYTDNKRTVDTIMWSAVMFIVIVIFIYIMNVNNLVRTEPRKLYWYPPKF